MDSGKQVPQGSERLRHGRGGAHLSAGGSGQPFDAEAVDTCPDTRPEAVDFPERETEVKLVPTRHPGYHPQYGGGVEIGRPFLATACDSPQTSSHIKRLRLPLQTAPFMGMMFNSSNAGIKHLFNATGSLKSLACAARKLACHATEVLRFGWGVQVTSPNAPASRRAQSAPEPGVPILRDRPALHLLCEGGQRKRIMFGNRSNSCHGVGASMMETNSGSGTANAWLICSRATIRRHGPGCARPAPVPQDNHLRNGPPEHRRDDFGGARPIAEAEPVPR